jgi:precorrin-2/cobalt-factor-2 C20-methyltransferase
MLYSTFLYLYECVKETYPEIELEIIPGVTSVTAAAASSKLPLAEKEEVVTIIPSDLSPAHIEDAAKHADNLVFMKCAFHQRVSTNTVERAFRQLNHLFTPNFI